MKVAITAQGSTLESQVDPRFGRANCFILVDDQSGDFQAIDNQQNINAAQGAGIQAGRIIAENKAEVLITGHCGPNAFKTLNAAGIKVVIGAEGTVAEALEKYKSGELKVSEGADVDGHW
jgi:predicted Fe-Mo cluster-binding NifX family protein